MKISEREKDVLRLLCLKNKDIAARLSIEICTVKTHINRLIDKLLVSNRITLLIEALKQNVISIDEIVME